MGARSTGAAKHRFLVTHAEERFRRIVSDFVESEIEHLELVSCDASQHRQECLCPRLSKLGGTKRREGARYYQPRSGVIYVAHSVSCGNVISLCSAAERRHI